MNIVMYHVPACTTVFISPYDRLLIVLPIAHDTVGRVRVSIWQLFCAAIASRRRMELQLAGEGRCYAGHPLFFLYLFIHFLFILGNTFLYSGVA